MSTGFFKKLSKKLTTILPPELISLLPHSYKKIGHVALIRFDSSLSQYKTLIAETILHIISTGGIRSVAEIVDGISGLYREPNIRIIAGDPSTITIHKELGCKFKLDVSNLMFSAGNHGERTRLVEWVKKIQDLGSRLTTLRILDMFACIGNLSLPIAKNIPNVHIRAIELNPEAFKYLQETVRMNIFPETSSFEIIHGDNRKISPINWSDIVLLGYFGIEKSHLQTALLSIRGPIGWLLIHDVIKLKGSSSVLNNLEIINKEMEISFEILSIKSIKIKSVGPGLEHRVFEVKIKVKF